MGEGSCGGGGVGTCSGCGDASLQHCADQCSSEANCVAFVYTPSGTQPHTQNCYLKGSSWSSTPEACSAEGRTWETNAPWQRYQKGPPKRFERQTQKRTGMGHEHKTDCRARKAAIVVRELSVNKSWLAREVEL